MTLGTSAAVRVATTHGGTLDLGSSSAAQLINVGLTLADGTGAGEADLAFTDTRTLAASASENIDLAGSLVDALGDAAVFARVKVLVVRASADNTNNVLVSRPASNGWATLFAAASDQLILRPGTVLAVVAGVADATGYTVTADTGDLLTVTNSAGSTEVVYDIAIVGCSA